MTANGYEKTDLTRNNLTDEDIETLYDIVRRAQSSTDKSSRALFAAYGAVLEEQGLQPSDDAVLHRFLFHMQRHRREGEDLVQRFGRVLKESFDIDVEINEDGEGIEVTTNLDATRNGAQASLGRYSRRGSFESFFDGTADKVAGTDYGDLSVRMRRGSHGAMNGYDDLLDPRRTRSDSQARAYGQALLPVRNKLNGNALRRAVSGPHLSIRKRGASVSSRGNLQIRRVDPTAPSRNDDNDADSEFTDRTTSLDLSHIQIPGVNAPIPDDRQDSRRDSRDYYQYVPEPYRPSDTRLLDDAETFEEQRLHRVTRQCIQRWRYRTQESFSRHDDMDTLALAFRRNVLLRVSFPLLYKAATIRRNNRETDRFFTRLESRADKARALFLLTKAFTHWATSAEDEVQRTSVARRHILRTRFFNGWRDITAVNELKIQHFVLGNFLRKWRAKAEEARRNEANAVAHYERIIANRALNKLKFTYFNIAAPAWHNNHVKGHTLRKMVEIAKILKDRGDWAVKRYEQSLLRQRLGQWQQRTLAVQSQQVQAIEQQRKSQLSSALHTLQKQAQLGPLIRQFQAHTNDRVIRGAFETWRKDAQLSQQARNVDRLRILRNAYTAWNDRLRSKVVEDRIDDRVIVKTLYKWTLASRVSLFQRVHDRQLKESTFLSWVTKANQRANTLDAAERRFAQFKQTQILRTCLRKMEVITSERRREEFAILAEYQKKLKQRIFDKLKERSAHFQQLTQWSKDARFYVLSKRTLKTWGEATQHARRNRRR
ncbi:Sfi1-domain-containing protein, partial [Plenodomus tracheiphilus IPT5]